jgi:cyclopropane-fatty-acyl-phospholipid synthase
MSLAVEIAERGWVPDPVIRLGIRHLLRGRLREIYSGGDPSRRNRSEALIRKLRESRVALETDAANAQHYEVPTEFFRLVLGRHMKYSACLFEAGVDSLDAAEAAMLECYAQRALLADGQRILDLGCGWGSFSLWAAARYPGASITAVSNSVSQRQWIEAEANRRGLGNLRVLTRDVNGLEFPAAAFDRVVSVEMFEHVRNYAELLGRIRRWLTAEGRLFVHIFCHREAAYPYEDNGDADWMARHFFTGGLMPSVDTLGRFDDDLVVEQQWQVSGDHYERTARCWCANLDANRDAARAALLPVYGDDVDTWLQRWRMFFMACEELFGYRDGKEWLVGHYRMKPRPAG